jgi:hypothetical protein
MTKFEPTREFYMTHRGESVAVGRTKSATVSFTRTSGQSGTWERGFKFHDSEWALLVRKTAPAYSMDHGKTWHATIFLAKKSKGKLRLVTNTRGEFAFDAIQKINRDYGR